MKDFLDEPQDFSSDLEWMLQSGQVDRATLVEALLGEYYAPVYRLFLAQLEEEEPAQAAALETFRTALNRLERYRSSRGAEVWLFGIAVEVCRKRRSRHALRRFLLRNGGRAEAASRSGPEQETDAALWETFGRLDENMRLIVILHALFGWDAQQSADLLKMNEAGVKSTLQGALASLRAVLFRAGSHVERLSDEQADQTVCEALGRRWPEVQFTPGELRWASEAVLRELERNGERRFSAPAGELFWVGALALLVLGLIWGSSRFMAEPENFPTAPPRAQTQSQAPKNTQRPAPTRTLIPITNPLPSPTPVSMMVYVAGPEETIRSLAEKRGVAPEHILARNPDLKDFDLDRPFRETTIIVIPLNPRTGEAIPTLIRSPDLELDPLDASSTSEEIRTFLLLSERLWVSMWGDASLIQHGPAGFVGRPLAARQQVWVSQPGRSRVMTGPLNGQPREKQIVSDGWIYYQLAGFQEGSMSQAPSPIPDTGLLNELIFPGRGAWIRQAGRFEVVEEVEHAGRQTLVVDQFDEAGLRQRRLWIDHERGVLLGQELFSPVDGSTLVQSLHFAQVVFDKSFPTEVFDPARSWREEFTANFLGGSIRGRSDPGSVVFEPAAGHEPLVRQTPPPGFDPSGSRLTFQYPGSASVETTPAANPPRVEVFADGYYLGNVSFARPWGMICDRSPDGRTVAFGERSHWLEFSATQTRLRLRWFSLDNLDRIRDLPFNLEPVDFAFSPDSRRLAVFGYGNNGSRIEIVDLETGDSESLLELAYAFSLVWSPEGEYLALIGMREYPNMSAMIVHVQGKRVIYDTVADLNTRQINPFRNDPFTQIKADLGPGWPSFSWPAATWEVEFPVLNRGLERCIEPPAGR